MGRSRHTAAINLNIVVKTRSDTSSSTKLDFSLAAGKEGASIIWNYGTQVAPQDSKWRRTSELVNSTIRRSLALVVLLRAVLSGPWQTYLCNCYQRIRPRLRSLEREWMTSRAHLVAKRHTLTGLWFLQH